MATKRGRPKHEGLSWHAAKGRWYRLYGGKRGGKMIYFGPSGRKGKEPDQSVYEDARTAWKQHEAISVGESAGQDERSHLRAETIEASRRLTTLGRQKAHLRNTIADATRAIESGGNPDAVREQLEEQISALRQQIDSLNAASNAASNLPPKGPTCQDVVDVYLSFLKSNATTGSYLDAKRRLSMPDAKLDAKKRQTRKQNGTEKTRTVKTWLEYIGPNTKISTLTETTFSGYRDSLNTLVKNGTIAQSVCNKMFRLVKASFNAARRDKGMRFPDMLEKLAILKTKKPPQADFQIFTRADIQKMMDTFDYKWQTVVLLSLNCCLSNADVAGISWGNVNLDEGYMDYPRAKTGRKRITPLWERTIQHLSEVKKRTKGSLIFTKGRNGSPYITFTENSFTDGLSVEFRKKMKALSLPYSFKTFRKSSASKGRTGGTLDDIEMLLGHAPNGEWSKYVVDEKTHLKPVVDAIERYYFPKESK